MTILGIDTSARGRTVVVLLGAGAGPHVETADEPLLGRLHAQLRGLDLDGLEAVAVATGPGTYTGLRAGLAAALGVAQARSLPLHGIPSLEVVAHGSAPELDDLLAVSDAGRGAVYAQRFRRRDGILTADEPPRRLAAAHLPDDPPAVRLDSAGAGAALVAAVPAALTRPALDLVGLTAVYVDATEDSRSP